MVHVSAQGVGAHLRAMGDIPGDQAGLVVIRYLAPGDSIVADSDSVTVELNGIAFTHKDGRRAYVSFSGVLIEDASPGAVEG